MELVPEAFCALYTRSYLKVVDRAPLLWAYLYQRTDQRRPASKDDAVRRAIPALSALAVTIGDPAVRHRGTIGGSLANNDPAADYPAAAIALGATIHTDRRAIAADDFFAGLFATVRGLW